MKNVLIIYPHWPPSNLAGVHRARLISNYLPDFGWHPIVVAVHEDYYEEEVDPDFLKTVSDKTEVIKVAAKSIQTSNVLIGDISLRAFSQLKQKAIEIIKNRKIDFIWVPIPSYYTAIIARQVYNVTKVPYGIDYIDPWVKPKDVAGSFLSKAWLSNQVAKLLEPYAVSKASLISGVATSYYQPVLDRNFKNKRIHHVGMPYGFDPNDHKIILEGVELPWSKETNAYLYAGAMLPKSVLFIKLLFKSIKKKVENGSWDKANKLYFIGTKTARNNSIKKLAEEYNIGDVVFETSERLPFLQILYFLSQAKGVLVLGGTEKHYTASKVFQNILSHRPIFAIFHHESSAIITLKNANADLYTVKYYEERSELKLEDQVYKTFSAYLENTEWNPDLNGINSYSCKESTRELVKAIERVI